MLATPRRRLNKIRFDCTDLPLVGFFVSLSLLTRHVNFDTCYHLLAAFGCGAFLAPLVMSCLAVIMVGFVNTYC